MPTPFCLNFAVTSRNLNIGTLVSLGVSAVRYKRLISSSSMPLSSIIKEKKDKESKELMAKSSGYDKVVIKDNGNGENSETIDVHSLGDDPGKIKAMTVQELRTALRSVGIAIRGRKSDLVTALKCYVEKTISGENSLSVGEQVSSVYPQSRSVKRKDKKLSDEDNIQVVNSVGEFSGLRSSKRRVKQSAVGSKNVQVDAEIVRTKQKLSIGTHGVSVPGSELSPAIKKVSVDDGFEDVRSSVRLQLPIDQIEPWTVLTHKKPQKGWIPYNPRTMRPAPLTGDSKSMKLMSWNVNGLRALLKLEGFSALQLAQRENFDVLCLQETKIKEKDVESIKQCLIEGYENSFWTCSVSKLGYSGTAIISRIKPLSVKYGLGISDHDNEGRLVTAEFDTFYLLCAYVPNSGDGLKRLSYRITQWDPSLSSYMKELEKSKPVILTGDLNCAHQEIDIYNPAGNRRSAGFTDEERQSFGTNFLSQGFVDTFRNQHPGVVGYTYWGYRHNGRKTNKGWRLDYFLVSDSIANNVHDSYILPDVTGSDHSPIGLTLKL